MCLGVFKNYKCSKSNAELIVIHCIFLIVRVVRVVFYEFYIKYLSVIICR